MFEEGQALSLHELIALDMGIEYERLPFKVYFTLPLAFKSMAHIKGENPCECNILNILGILGNGGMSICGIGYEEEGLVFGNILRDNIKGVWEDNPTLTSLRNGIPSGLKGVCGMCIFKGLCLGYCRANAYTIDKDLLAPYWLCQKAYNEGSFPKTRLLL
ncbi:MAG: hypothetical protein HY878_03105 [Deltaproteobacteria bacterium]|nr:hypothetical protein [Deltaproteobacteria bacterium]